MDGEIELGLMDQVAKPFMDRRGVYHISGREFFAADLTTGARVGNIAGWLWGQGSLLMGPSPSPGEGLFTREHFTSKVDYLVIVVRCDHSVSEVLATDVGMAAPVDWVIELGLVDRPKPFKDRRGVHRIDGRDLFVADVNTGVRVGNVAGMLWGPGSILMEPADEGLFTREHFDPGADYLVIVVRCDHVLREDRRAGSSD